MSEQISTYLQLKMCQLHGEMAEIKWFTKEWYNKRAAFNAYKDAYSQICEEDILYFDWK